MTDLVPVRVPCPSGQHPDGDSVSLRPKLGLAAGIAAQQTIQGIGKGVSSAEVSGTLLELYLRHGVADWTLHNGDGKPYDLTPEALQEHLLDDFVLAEPVADKADSLYYAAVVAPLVAAASKSSQATPPADSMSASTDSPAPRQKRSKRSSTSPTQTDGIESTSS
jgi:hypothetical protein